MTQIDFSKFLEVDIRVGKIIEVTDFPEARKPAFKLKIDFGSEIGIKNSSAQITKHYTKESLHNKLVIAVINFPPKQIGNFMSQVLTLGVPDTEGEVVLLQPEQDVPLGSRMF